VDKVPDEAGSDSYQVDFTTSTGAASRWVSLVNVTGKKIGYPNRREEDKKLLVYQTPVLSYDLEVTGHPLITLYVRSSDRDPQFFVYLEDIAPTGSVRYVTEGQFRGKHRSVPDIAPGYKLPFPQHTYLRRDALLLVPGEVAEIRFDLQPVSYLFKRGHAIRVALAGADKDNFEILPSTAPEWEILRTAEYPSSISLPIKCLAV
jgi:putative CocE/NonD family hydrolase